MRRGEKRLKVDDQFELEAGATETLVLHPPRPSFDRVSDYSFSLEYELNFNEPSSIISCKGVLTSIADVRVNPTLLATEFVRDSSPQLVRMEVTRTARRREDAEQAITTSGWPEGAQVEEPERVGEVTQVLDNLWKQTWRVTARIARPNPSATPQELWPIRVGGLKPESPSNNVQLMIRFRSGLSGPKLVHFGDVRVGQPATRRIQILSRDDQPFRILGPSDPQEPLSLNAESAEASKAHWGNLTMTAKEPGDFRQMIQVTTDHPEQTALSIEVRANVTAPVAVPDSASPPARQ